MIITPNRAKKIPSLCGALLVGFVWLIVGRLEAQLINVDFNENNAVGWGGGGPNPGPTMTGAAVLGTASNYWNGIAVNSGTNISLKYADGSASPVKMTFTSGGGVGAANYGLVTQFTVPEPSSLALAGQGTRLLAAGRRQLCL